MVNFVMFVVFVVFVAVEAFYAGRMWERGTQAKREALRAKADYFARKQGI